MPDDTAPPIGMSIGASTLAAATAAGVATRKPVLTLYHGRHPEVGVPAENPHLGTDGLVVTGFVDRVGDPADMVGTDGFTRTGADLLADAVHQLAYVATAGRPLPPAATISHPAHWPPAAVAALRDALDRVADWPHTPTLVSDAAATLTALRHSVPEHGIVALCDVGGSGTSLSLLDIADGNRPLAATLRHREFSGDRVDQLLVTRVVADLGAVPIGSLAALRGQCRSAKELLSTCALATLAIDGGVPLDRSDLDDVLSGPLDAFLAAMRDMLDHDQVRRVNLAAVVLAGGMAAVPAIATRIQHRLGVPVITAPQPHTAAAVGALLQAGGVAPALTSAA